MRSTHPTHASVAVTKVKAALYLDQLVLPLGSRVEVLVHLVQEPLEELEGVVLLVALVLGAVPLHHLLEAGAQFWAVLAGPEGLQEEGQLLGDLALGTELLRVELVAPGQVHLVPVQDEVLGQDVGVGYALEDRVDEAGVAVVLEARDARRVVGAPRLQSDRRHAVVAVDDGDAPDVLRYLVDELSDRGPPEHLLRLVGLVVGVVLFRLEPPLRHPGGVEGVPGQRERSL